MIKNIMKNIGVKPAGVKEKVKLFDEYKLPTKEAILKRNEFLKGKNVDPKKLGNKEFNTLAKELDDALGIGDISLSQELLVSDEEEKPEMLNKSWSKEDVIEELPDGWKRVEGALTAPNGYIVVSNNKSHFGGDRETKLIKQEDYDKYFAEEK